MLPGMNRATSSIFRTVTVAICCLCPVITFRSHAQDLNPSQVLVIYNKACPDSDKLAELYQVERKIPNDQILGLTLPTASDISREEYDIQLLKPLREHFSAKGWWKRGKDRSGLMRPKENRIRAIVLMRGVPLRIKATPVDPKEKLSAERIMVTSDQASVDSELSLFGIEFPHYKGPVPNDFFGSQNLLSKARSPHLVLVSRIDAPTFEVCKNMISDAVQTETHGLWGRAYVDIANKFPQGDAWLKNIVFQNIKSGIPTVADHFSDTLPSGYPMSDASIYYGWYERNVNGPFLNPSFKFRSGAIAFHIHSFSAEQLTDPNKNWSAALLTRGAAATVGNVYEPFLHNSHHLDILHDRLLRGWTFAEAAAAAMPVHSWQGMVLGDPLYRPFMHFSGTGEILEKDRDFRAIRAASRQWPDDDNLRMKKLELANQKLATGRLAESLANEYLIKKDIPNAQIWFKKARDSYKENSDKLRQDLQLIAIERTRKNDLFAIQLIQSAQKNYGNLPEAEALAKWLDILQKSVPPAAGQPR
jgi:uncharacterized protein (TIGR03790 family)